MNIFPFLTYSELDHATLPHPYMHSKSLSEKAKSYEMLMIHLN